MNVFTSIWNGLSKFASTFGSFFGSWIPATVAVFKTDTNVFYQVFCFLIMTISYLATFYGICWLMVSAYNQLVFAISFGNNPFWTSIVGFSAYLILALLFHSPINFFIRTFCLTPAVIIYLCGHKEASIAYFNAIRDQKQHTINAIDQ